MYAKTNSTLIELENRVNETIAKLTIAQRDLSHNLQTTDRLDSWVK
jgi:hypothetical protein